jgi:hypothetical protein
MVEQSLIDKAYLEGMAHHVGEGGRLTHENAVEQLQYILATREPVSVSLEKMSNTVAALYTNWETFTAQRPSPRETAKAVLDAAGVKYE